MKGIYLSFGSNIGDRELHIKNAAGRLSSVGKILRTTPLAETDPVDYINQNKFLNCVSEFEYEGPPSQLLAEIKKIEKEMGRIKTINKGPRNIDIDILLFGKTIISTDYLVIPHASLKNRIFFLEMLTSLSPDITDPASGIPYREYLNETK